MGSDLDEMEELFERAFEEMLTSEMWAWTPPPAAKPCVECEGKGRYLLFSHFHECKPCKGTGKEQPK